MTQADLKKLLNEIKTKEKLLAQNFDIASNQYFRGHVSLPFFMCKISDMQKNVLSDAMLGRAFKETMIDFINKKLMLNYNNPLDLNYQMFKLQKQQDTHNAILQANGYVKNIYADLDLSEH